MLGATARPAMVCESCAARSQRRACRSLPLLYRSATHRLTGQSTKRRHRPPEEQRTLNERIGIVGSGTIACGLAATAAHHGPVSLLARSESSADARRRRSRRRSAAWRPRSIPSTSRSYTDISALAHVSFAVEAVVEDHEVKAADPGRTERDPRRARRSSPRPPPRCRWSAWRRPAGARERFLGLHVFNPVTRMKLVELVFPKAASTETRYARRCAVRGV